MIYLINVTKRYCLCSDIFSTRGVAGARDVNYVCAYGSVLILRLGEERCVIAHTHLNTHQNITTAHNVLVLKNFK